VNPKGVIEIGGFFGGREIELAFAEFERDLKFREAKMELEWSLPSSKTDPTARGTSRTWGRLCEGSHRKPCPVHAFLEHRAELQRRFADGAGNLPRDLPAFPDSSGRVVRKEAFV
jgi:hypothetical protein